MEKIGILDPAGKNINPLTGNIYDESYRTYSGFWSKLPAYKYVDDIINKVKNNQVILIVSSTGSGKTVLLPKILLHVLDYKGKIAVTLPKQIIAKSAAEYAAKTLDVKLGTHVGYQYKGSDKSGKSAYTKILYATDGTIVAQLMIDPLLMQYDGVIIDEAHERKVQIDFLLYLLKQVIEKRPEFKLIIMSATINEQIFKNYFKKFKYDSFNIGGERIHPIESIFLEKSISQNEYMEVGMNIIKKLIKNKSDGDIMFFVTSVNETFDSCKQINTETGENYCIEVYAGINKDNQELAQDKELYKSKFKKTKKIVIATNVAESSLTIDGIKYVIDSGLELHGYYDPNLRARILNKSLITQAQARQRMGRAGRTGPGVCYHLYTKNDFEKVMPEFPEPTIKTSNIYGECLKLLALPSIQTVKNLTKILGNFIEPPDKTYVDNAISQLTELKLVSNTGDLTQLGIFIGNIPFDPMQSLTLYAAYRLYCIKDVLAIIIMIDTIKGNIGELFKKPNVDNNMDSDSDDVATDSNASSDTSTKSYKKKNPMLEKLEAAKASLAHKYGDHLTLLNIFSKYNEYSKDDTKLDKWLYSNFLKKSVLEKAKRHYKSAIYMIHNMFKSVQPIKTDLSNELKIISCFAYGYKPNKAYLHSSNKYKTDYTNDVTISRESSVKLKNNLIYYELFGTGNKLSLTIVSYISPRAEDLLNRLENE